MPRSQINRHGTQIRTFSCPRDALIGSAAAPTLLLPHEVSQHLRVLDLLPLARTLLQDLFALKLGHAHKSARTHGDKAEYAAVHIIR